MISRSSLPRWKYRPSGDNEFEYRKSKGIPQTENKHRGLQKNPSEVTSFMSICLVSKLFSLLKQSQIQSLRLFKKYSSALNLKESEWAVFSVWLWIQQIVSQEGNLKLEENEWALVLACHRREIGSRIEEIGSINSHLKKHLGHLPLINFLQYPPSHCQCEGGEFLPFPSNLGPSCCLLSSFFLQYVLNNWIWWIWYMLYTWEMQSLTFSLIWSVLLMSWCYLLVIVHGAKDTVVKQTKPNRNLPSYQQGETDNKTKNKSITENC